mmetsp:Transcript_71488/g.149453  ORF Transcript_71488/g.149453 Transcript_71488/m.149453 type:complete len:202 (-) Transcript_71488:116-721(-)
MLIATEIVQTFLYIFVDLPRCVQECGLHILPSLRRGFLKEQAVLLSKPCSLVVRNFAVLQVALVANEHHDHVWLSVGSRVIEPPSEVVEGPPSTDVVDEQGACRPSIVGLGDRSESLLASCVPDLKLDLVILDLHDSVPELDTNGHIMLGSKTLVRELKKQTGLADAGIADDNVLEKEVVILPCFLVHPASSATSRDGHNE